MMKKKADANWVLVSMVLAIIVLAIVAFLFWKYSTESAEQGAGIARCQARGGSCSTSGECSPGEISLGRYSCDPGQVCCIPVKKSDEPS